MHIPKLKNFIKTKKEIINWHSYFLDHWLKKKGKHVYFMKDGSILLSRGNTDDRYIINEIYIKHIYNPCGFEIKEEDVIVDIGAHIGVFTIYASKKARNGKIYSFEPTTVNFNLLRKNIILSEGDNIVYKKEAVSDKGGFKEINIAPNTGGHSLNVEGNSSSKEKVKTTTLQEIIKINKISKINLLKLDCEGSEYGILFSCSDKILENIDKISLEYHNLDEKRNGRKIKEFLEKKGFKTIVNRETHIIYAKKV